VARSGPAEVRHLRALARASLAGRVAHVRWRHTETTTVTRAVDVLAVAFDAPRWIVAAWCRELRALRVLSLDRVLRVQAGRTRTGPPPDGFDPIDFGLHRFLDPDVGPPEPVALWLEDALAEVAPALLPTVQLDPALFGGSLCRIRASRRDVVAALADSLGPGAAVDFGPRMPTTTKQAGTAEARLLKLASWLLSQGEPVTRNQIVETFPDEYRGRPDAVERKFSRDKDALRRLGYAVEPVELGSREEAVGYVIDARSCSLPRIDLTPDEAALVWTAGVGALRFSTHPLADELESALRKLLVGAKGLPPRAAAPEELRDECGGAAERKVLEKLVDAWERRKRVTIGYWRVATNEVVERQVDVYGWASRRGEWILVGHDHLRNGVRIFYLSRVRTLKVNTVRPQDPDYAVPDGFDIRRWSRQQIWDYNVHAPQQAVIRFRGSLARIARQLLPAASVRTDEAGFRVARLEVRNLRGLVRQALAWGPEAELLEPADGRRMAREILASLGARKEVTP
jgi:predicted DNA-binding transcriptional regulator YafY